MRLAGRAIGFHIPRPAAYTVTATAVNLIRLRRDLLERRKALITTVFMPLSLLAGIGGVGNAAPGGAVPALLTGGRGVVPLTRDGFKRHREPRWTTSRVTGTTRVLGLATVAGLPARWPAPAVQQQRHLSGVNTDLVGRL